MNNRKYHPEQYELAKKMYESGEYSLEQIRIICQFKSKTPVRYHCIPSQKERWNKQARDWIRRNPERNREIARKAQRKFQKKHA